MAVLSNLFLKESNPVEYCTNAIVILDSVVNTICIPEGPGDTNSPFTSSFPVSPEVSGTSFIPGKLLAPSADGPH